LCSQTFYMEIIVKSMFKGNQSQKKSANTESPQHCVKFCNCRIVVSLKNASESDKMNIAKVQRTTSP
jgi:hypothetical protein